jgi:hypothetical protein
MVQLLLERYESGNLDAWWQLSRVLTLAPESTYYGDEFAADLTTMHLAERCCSDSSALRHSSTRSRIASPLAR